MTKIAIAQTQLSESRDAGRALGRHLAETLQTVPDAVILFASPTYEFSSLLQALKQECRPKCLVGCSSAGEFTHEVQGEGMACALALCSSEMQFTAARGHQLRDNHRQAAEEVVSVFHGISNRSFRYRYALVLVDALAGYTEEFIEQLTLLTAGSYQFFGGGAGDNAQFRHTPVFYDTQVLSDAVVTLEILSKKPWGIGVQHGWRPSGSPMRATETQNMHLISLNAIPAVEALQEHALATEQVFDLENPLPFFLHNILGIDTGFGYKLRVPLAADTAGSILCAAAIPSGVKVSLMQASSVSSVEAAASAVENALAQLNGGKPAAALFFDCVATRLRMGREFGLELKAIQERVGSTPLVGCNTHGQIARSEGQFNGFHNCTAVVCLIPE